MVTMLVTGDNVVAKNKKIEIIKENFETQVCNNLPKYPLNVEKAAGSLWKNGKFTICGGEVRDDGLDFECFSFENGKWQSTKDKLQSTKYGHGSSNIGNAIFLTGGFNRFQWYVN